MRARSDYTPPVDFSAQDIRVSANGNPQIAPTTLYYMGTNKVRFRGVASREDLIHNRCIVVGEDKMVYQNVTGPCKLTRRIVDSWNP